MILQQPHCGLGATKAEREKLQIQNLNEQCELRACVTSGFSFLVFIPLAPQLVLALVVHAFFSGHPFSISPVAPQEVLPDQAFHI